MLKEIDRTAFLIIFDAAAFKQYFMKVQLVLAIMFGIIKRLIGSS